MAWPAGSPLQPEAGGVLTGDVAWAWAFAASLAAGFAAYLLGLRALARRGARVGAVVALALAVQLSPLAAPLLLSSDAWTYWAYGRIAAVHDANPYRDAPAEFSDDPAHDWVGSRWLDTTSVYGPAFTLASEPVARAAGDSEDAAAWAYKALAGLAACATVLLAARWGAFAAAFVGWNPLLAVHLAGGGHNDAWVGALLLAALAAEAVGRRWSAGVAWALGIAVKWVPLVFLPLRLLAARSARGLLPVAAVALALAAVASWRYGLAWLGAFGPLGENAELTTSFSLPRRLSALGVPLELAIGFLVAVFVGVYAWLLREARRGRARLALAGAALLACSPYVAPWYLAWVVPLAAVEEDRLARGATLALCAYLLPQTLPL